MCQKYHLNLDSHLMHRRELLAGSVLSLATTAIATLAPRAAWASDLSDPQLLSSLEVCTPKDALARLMLGNTRFAKAWMEARGMATPTERMQVINQIWSSECQIDPLALEQGQRPFAATLSCADSRVDPSWLFACGTGELFEVRCAGNTAFNDAVASLEYAVSSLGTQLILVIGHSGCGAVKAAMDSAPLTPLLEDLVRPIRASITGATDLSHAVRANARNAAAHLSQRSDLLRAAQSRGLLTIRSAYCDLGTGVVTLI
jgi:carbonic anhydrase